MLRSWLAAVFILLAPAAAPAAPAQASVLPELIRLAEKEAQAGDERAKGYLDLQRVPRPDKATRDLGAKWVLEKAAQRVPAAQFMLGIVLEERRPPEYEGARKYYEQAAAQGYVPAMTRLAIFCEHGRGGPVDRAKAFEWAMKGAKGGDSDAQMFVAAAYMDGKLMPKDMAKAVEWLEKAGEQGEPRVPALLAAMYATGEGVPRNEERAKYWASKAATASELPAQEKAARARALERDPAAGVLFDAAARGDVPAQSRIGYLFLEGKRYPQDFELAAYYLTKAAEANDAGALINLGSMHAHGQKFARDDAEAARWYRKASDKGVAEGQYRFAIYVLEGRGAVKRDPVEAARLFRLAADKQHAKAERELATMYERGLGGLPRDRTQAVELYRRAAGHGDKAAQQRLDALTKTSSR